VKYVNARIGNGERLVERSHDGPAATKVLSAFAEPRQQIGSTSRRSGLEGAKRTRVGYGGGPGQLQSNGFRKAGVQIPLSISLR
jgi:hypothetical protein